MNFHDRWIFADIETTNDYYTLYHNPLFPFMYEYNFLLLHVVPTLEMFQIIEDHLADFHSKQDILHLKFTWPENEGLTPPVASYLEEAGYGLDMLELYCIHPKDFAPSRLHPTVTLAYVTSETLPLFKQISFEQDAAISASFAEEKKLVYDQQFATSSVQFVLAMIDTEPVGGVTVFETENTVEIDSLFVRDTYQRQGIGASIQAFVMTHASDRIVLLLADASDSPREMYAKQGYVYQGFQISALKIEDKTLESNEHFLLF